MYLNYPIRKDFVLPFVTTKGKIIIKYKQATIEEQIKFTAYNNDQAIAYIWDLIKSSIEFVFNRKKGLFEPNFLYINKTNKDKINMLKELENNFVLILQSILETKYRKHKSIFSFLIADNWGRKSIFNADISILCEKFNIKWPNEFIETYTLEQLEWMNDWLIFISNETNDKDKIKNDKVLWRELPEEDLEKLRQFRNLYNKSWNIKLKNNGDNWRDKGTD